MYCHCYIDELGDVRSMFYDDESFDCVIDKGLLDSILVLEC